MDYRGLYRTSKKLLLEQQQKNGAFLASPQYPTYQYCWFRDSSYIAYALQSAGEQTAALQFHRWAAGAILKRKDQVEQIIRQIETNRASGHDLLNNVSETQLLHTRYTAEGGEGNAAWENFQLDGFGTWLWAAGALLREHPAAAESSVLHEAIKLTGRYLAVLGSHPCYDLWEENRPRVHTYTLASVAAGLKTAAALNSRFSSLFNSAAEDALNQIRAAGERFGYFPKFCDDGPSGGIDASVTALAVPYELIPADDPVMRSSIRKVEADLLDKGGVRRFASDTFYGGGRWILLTCWLAWYYLRMERFKDSQTLLTWAAGTRNERGELPEQENSRLIDPAMYKPWVEKWGKPAVPLLWSHAMFMLAWRAYEQQGTVQES